ncbi:MAG TPA: hypothetical protein RMH99_31065 [Sandaracinaceae bacterium LLY-WYZ-13_1]|nr:hypothetical protein [Sandaracinaceae bacterium LLY-WYZ-13_1]
MRRLAPLALGLGLAALLAPATASAQEIMVTIQDFEGRSTTPSLMQLGQNPTAITADECDANAQITFRFAMIDTMRTNLQFWEGTNCDDPTVRVDETTTTCQPILLEGDTQLEFAIEGRAMIDRMIPVSDLVPCGSGTSGTENIWVLAVENRNSEVTGAGQQVQFDVAYDFQGPSPPTDFSARDGEDSAEITWMGSSEGIREYEVFYVPNGCVDGSPTAEAQMLLGEMPDLSYRLSDMPGSGSTSADVRLTGLALGEEAAVAVRAVDTSGNAGALTEIECVMKIDVTSWLEAYCNGSGASADACGGESCRVATPGRSSSGVAGWLLAAAAALVWTRRRMR